MSAAPAAPAARPPDERIADIRRLRAGGRILRRRQEGGESIQDRVLTAQRRLEISSIQLIPRFNRSLRDGSTFEKSRRFRCGRRTALRSACLDLGECLAKGSKVVRQTRLQKLRRFQRISRGLLLSLRYPGDGCRLGLLNVQRLTL
jgi:hypothetical protein